MATPHLRHWVATTSRSLPKPRSDHYLNLFDFTTLQSVMNAKLSKQRFWHCHENSLIKTIQTIFRNLYVSVTLTSLYCGLWLILVYPNPQ